MNNKLFHNIIQFYLKKQNVISKLFKYKKYTFFYLDINNNNILLIK